MSTMPGSGKPAGYSARGTVLSSSTIIGDAVVNRQDQKLGRIEDIMLDSESGEIRYAVMSAGGILGIGEKFFAIPWKALHLDKTENRFLLDVDAERLKHAPGFDKDNWPDMADPTWVDSVGSYYATGCGTGPSDSMAAGVKRPVGESAI